MISLKNPDQIGKMRKAGALLYEVLQQAKAYVRPGMTTLQLDAYVEDLIRRNHAIPSSKGYSGFPCSICASPDDMIVHGIPSDKVVLKEGSILSIDCTLVLDGWQADSAVTVGIGEISDEAQRLIRVTEQAFFAGAKLAVAGNRLGDISYAVQTTAEGAGFGVVRDFTGHGIGREMHEDPTVYNFGRPGHGVRLRQGMTICVEPMITAGDWHCKLDADGWGARTVDHSLCSHYEHTVAVAEEGALPELLTYPGFRWEEVL